MRETDKESKSKDTEESADSVQKEKIKEAEDAYSALIQAVNVGFHSTDVLLNLDEISAN